VSDAKPYSAEAKAGEFGDKWLPAFQSAFLERWADRFYNELATALREAHAAGVQASAKVAESWVADIGGRLMEGNGYRPLLEGGAAAASSILKEIRSLDGGDGGGRGAKALGDSEESGSGYQRSTTVPSTTPKYVCPMKRPSGAPKNCQLCRKMGSETPGECDCCGAALIPSAAPLPEKEPK